MAKKKNQKKRRGKKDVAAKTESQATVSKEVPSVAGVEKKKNDNSSGTVVVAGVEGEVVGGDVFYSTKSYGSKEGLVDNSEGNNLDKAGEVAGEQTSTGSEGPGAQDDTKAPASSTAKPPVEGGENLNTSFIGDVTLENESEPVEDTATPSDEAKDTPEVEPEVKKDAAVENKGVDVSDDGLAEAKEGEETPSSANKDDPYADEASNTSYEDLEAAKDEDKSPLMAEEGKEVESSKSKSKDEPPETEPKDRFDTVGATEKQPLISSLAGKIEKEDWVVVDEKEAKNAAKWETSEKVEEELVVGVWARASKWVLDRTCCSKRARGK